MLCCCAVAADEGAGVAVVVATYERMIVCYIEWMIPCDDE
jgi:hypothetical protein